NLTDLHAIVQAWIRTFPSRGPLEAQLDEAKIALGTVRSVADLAGTGWTAQWGAVEDVPDRVGGTYRVPGPPWRFSAGPLDPPGVPAFQGEDNHSVLAEIGYRPDEIAALVADGALVTASIPRDVTTVAPGDTAPSGPAARHPDSQPSTPPTA